MEEKIKALMEDEAFVAKLVEFETPEEVVAAFREKDVEVSVDDITNLKKQLEKMSENGGELSEDELESVAGGSITGLIIAGISCAISAATFTHEATRRRW